MTKAFLIFFTVCSQADSSDCMTVKLYHPDQASRDVLGCPGALDFAVRWTLAYSEYNSPVVLDTTSISCGTERPKNA